MIDVAAGAALIVVAGGIAAVTARDGRSVVLGLTAAFVAAPLVASPMPASLSAAARIVGAMLAAWLLWAAARRTSVASPGFAAGPLTAAIAAVAAFVVGLQPVIVAHPAGPLSAQAAGFALLVLAIAPLLGRDVLRLGTGVVLLTLAASLLRTAWAAPAAPFEQLAFAALLVGVAGAASLAVAGLPQAASAAPLPTAPRGQSLEAAIVTEGPAQPAADPEPTLFGADLAPDEEREVSATLRRAKNRRPPMARPR